MRWLTSDDILVANEIFNSLTPKQQKFVNPDNIQEEMIDYNLCLVQYINPQKTGYARVWRKDYDAPTDEGEVEIALKPSAQGKGEGFKLLQKLVEKSKEKGIKKLIYAPDKTNNASIHLIRKFATSVEKINGEFVYIIETDEF